MLQKKIQHLFQFFQIFFFIQTLWYFDFRFSDLRFEFQISDYRFSMRFSNIFIFLNFFPRQNCVIIIIFSYNNNNCWNESMNTVSVNIDTMSQDYWIIKIMSVMIDIVYIIPIGSLPKVRTMINNTYSLKVFHMKIYYMCHPTISNVSYVRMSR